MTVTINYKDEFWTTVATMNDVSKDDAVLIACKYMSQFPSIDAASILGGGTEMVVSKATEWQKRNG